MQPVHPSLYQVNTRILLNELGRSGRGPATLDDVPDALLDGWRERGFDWLYFLGVWQTGPAGRRVSRTQPDWRREFDSTLPDLRDDDITGSPFAIRAYSTASEFGGDAALARLRERLRKRGLKLMLDFVPNHTAPDHPWVQDHPEFYIAGDAGWLEREPANYCKIGDSIFAYGRDPYFAGWPDTLQLNHRHAGLRRVLAAELAAVAARCDGVRCDMAMLVLPEIFQRTWGDRALPADGSKPVDDSFWPEAIGRVRERLPGFVFMAEVYWDLEWQLQQQGFDYTYDKRLYDRLHVGDPWGVRGHLHADLDFQNRSARFLENHDEPRAAATFPPGVYEAAGIVTYFVPGLRFFHDGQFEGRRTRVSMHLGRRPDETINHVLRDYYARLLDALKRPEPRTGSWHLLEARATWEANHTWGNFIVSRWDGPDAAPWLLAVVNFGNTEGQCFVPLGREDLRGGRFVFRDLLSHAVYDRNGDDLAERGLYLDMPAWGYHVFEVTRE